MQELQYSFLRDWYFITEEDPHTLLAEEYFPQCGAGGDVTARLINSGPSTEKDVAVETFFNAVALAKMKNLIHEELESSDEVLLTEWHTRPARHRLLENLAALMGPVL